MFPRTLLVLSAILWYSTVSSQDLSAQQVLERSIGFHDPNNEWPSLQAALSFSETRPNGTDRSTTAEIDNAKGWFKLDRKEIESHGMKMDSCFVLYGDVDCDRAAVMRNYYLYLWGLPMKLMDEDTPLEEQVREETHDGQPCYVLRVPYEADIWYFYIAKENYQMVAYKFYKDEAAGKGELITTDGLYHYGQMKLPNHRTWYVLPGNRELGTDILTGMETLDK